ncbi:hypothetical protein C7S18_23865 (plasmid) [Ahniella affigens]|uniref:Uncharacterized protein n=1 Tax=Ahniella affigens TaxID=2021234 RepID=A0A2P1PZS0_9GAMM|nr:hypothetical protein C7S18_23865 [Ahniella affigens]
MTLDSTDKGVFVDKLRNVDPGQFMYCLSKGVKALVFARIARSDYNLPELIRARTDLDDHEWVGVRIGPGRCVDLFFDFPKSLAEGE